MRPNEPIPQPSPRWPRLEAHCFAAGQAAAREYLANGGPRPRSPLRVSSPSPTQQAMASAWYRGYYSIDPPDYASFDDSPPKDFPPYRYGVTGGNPAAE